MYRYHPSYHMQHTSLQFVLARILQFIFSIGADLGAFPSSFVPFPASVCFLNLTLVVYLSDRLMCDFCMSRERVEEYKAG